MTSALSLDWLKTFEASFTKQFPKHPDDEMARKAIEQGVALDRVPAERPKP